MRRWRLKAVGTRERGEEEETPSMVPSLRRCSVRALRVSEDPDGEVFDVRGPLSRQLEKLDVVPLDAVNQHCGGETQRQRRCGIF